MRIGIVGAGQLGLMLGTAARALGHECLFLDPADEPPAGAAGPVRQAAFDNVDALAELADRCEVLTYEFENVPVEALAGIASSIPVYPPLAALRQAQDRLVEKKLFDSLDIPVPAYRAVDSADDLQAAAAALGLPLLVKTRRMGYDGKGQFLLRDAADAAAAWRKLGEAALLAEQWVEFDFEVSIIGTRGRDGQIATYCLTRNEHASGILQVSRAPVNEPPLDALARQHVTRLLEHLDYVGVLALELFVVDGRLLANEFAPRVHNSGHWTIEGAATSQFENHVRAVTGAPLGSPAVRGHAGMVNLIGRIPQAARHLERGWLHDYGKVARPGRKLGHITVVAASAAARDRLLDDIKHSVTGCSAPAGHR
jgi:5-(carboxyamino)imidazole ribonucleotide synthase